jgi:hypothetical protein
MEGFKHFRAVRYLRLHPRIKNLWFYNDLCDFMIYLIIDLAQWSEYLFSAHEVAGSILGWYKHLCASTCLYVLGLGDFYV